jgi:hypothetical protein
MRRRSQFLTILVCFIASSALANAAFAQFAGATWKRWDWSFLYPGDETSSTVARMLKAEGSLEQCSVGLFAAETETPSADDFAAESPFAFGKCQIASVATQFSRGTRWCHQQTLKLCNEFRATWEATLVEMKCQAERIVCARAALLETESQRRAREYWSYYEDRNRWLGNSASPLASGKGDWKFEALANSFGVDGTAEFILSSLSETPSAKIAATGREVNRLLDRTALSVLELNEQLVGSSLGLQSSQKRMKQTFRLASATLSRGENRAEKNRAWLSRKSIQCCESFAIATTQEAREFIDRVESVVRDMLDGAISFMGLLPVEAIGYVFAE